MCTLQALTRGSVRFEFPLSSLTSFKVGGRAEAFYEASAIDELSRVIAFAAGAAIPYAVIGRGSNILVRDQGLGGLVIRLGGEISRVRAEQAGSGHELICGAGAELKDVLRFCGDEGWGGLEFLAGIPGSVGGAIAVNAGAFGSDIGGKVSGIKVVKPDGSVEAIGGRDLHFGYRDLSLDRRWIIVEGALAVERAKKDDVRSRIKNLIKTRKEKQPLDAPSAGSIFRNPAEDYAGRLIEAAGLKGMKRGGAMISPVHANWIVNTGGACSEDIIWLIKKVSGTVKEESGIELELEIRIMGDDA
jgi:UDP-N-acetylmuramate dehydrogenase